MIKRICIDKLNKLLESFPAVLICGPRQCGKTTLVKNYIRAQYYDLERPSDVQVFSNDIEFALRKIPKPLIIDEVQCLPEVFSVLRSLIDEKREENGQYILLGSVNPLALEEVSESLAGRVGIFDLTPLLYKEVCDNYDIERLWFCGGFPNPFLSKDIESWILWQENYIRTFIERDISGRGISISPMQIRTFLGMIANSHGNIFNSSEIGKSIGLTYHTVNKYLDILESCFLIRRLQPYYANIKKRLVKSPKLYIRDTGILHSLLGINSDKELLENPKRGSSWEGFIIEQLIALESLRISKPTFSFFRSHTGIEVDLIIERGAEKLGIEIKLSSSVKKEDCEGLNFLLEEGIITKGIVIYRGERDFELSKDIKVYTDKTALINGVGR